MQRNMLSSYCVGVVWNYFFILDRQTSKTSFSPPSLGELSLTCLETTSQTFLKWKNTYKPSSSILGFFFIEQWYVYSNFEKNQSSLEHLEELWYHGSWRSVSVYPHKQFESRRQKTGSTCQVHWPPVSIVQTDTPQKPRNPCYWVLQEPQLGNIPYSHSLVKVFLW